MNLFIVDLISSCKPNRKEARSQSKELPNRNYEGQLDHNWFRNEVNIVEKFVTCYGCIFITIFRRNGTIGYRPRLFSSTLDDPGYYFFWFDDLGKSSSSFYLPSLSGSNFLRRLMIMPKEHHFS